MSGAATACRGGPHRVRSDRATAARKQTSATRSLPRASRASRAAPSAAPTSRALAVGRAARPSVSARICAHKRAARAAADQRHARRSSRRRRAAHPGRRRSAKATPSSTARASCAAGRVVARGRRTRRSRADRCAACARPTGRAGTSARWPSTPRALRLVDEQRLRSSAPVSCAHPAAGSWRPTASRSSGARCRARQWQKAWTARAGFGRNAVVRDEQHAGGAERQEGRRPARRRRCRAALAALSPPPPATTGAAARPQLGATSGAQRAGRLACLRPGAASASRRARSRPAAPRDQSPPRHVEPQRAGGIGHVGHGLAGQPQPHVVLRQQHARATAAKISGSCSRTHSSLGAVKPGIARLPAMRASSRLAPLRARRIRAALRPSFHRIAGRSTRSSCVEQHRRRASGPTGRCRARRRTLRAAPRAARPAPRAWRATSRAGSCSDHSGCGRDTASGARAVATTRCVIVEQQRLDLGRADVDAEVHWDAAATETVARRPSVRRLDSTRRRPR